MHICSMLPVCKYYSYMVSGPNFEFSQVICNFWHQDTCFQSQFKVPFGYKMAKILDLQKCQQNCENCTQCCCLLKCHSLFTSFFWKFRFRFRPLLNKSNNTYFCQFYYKKKLFFQMAWIQCTEFHKHQKGIYCLFIEIGYLCTFIALCILLFFLADNFNFRLEKLFINTDIFFHSTKFITW